MILVEEGGAERGGKRGRWQEAPSAAGSATHRAALPERSQPPRPPYDQLSGFHLGRVGAALRRVVVSGPEQLLPQQRSPR